MKFVKPYFPIFFIALIYGHVIEHFDVLKTLNGIVSKKDRRLQLNTKTIGVITLPISKVLKNKIHQSIVDSDSGKNMIDQLNEMEQMSFFPSSYTKWLRDQGVQVVPINIYNNDEDMEFFMRNVDGILLTGGAVPLLKSDIKIRLDEAFSAIIKLDDLSFYSKKVKTIVNIAKRINDEQNNVYPIWGTCLGFEGLILAQTEFMIKFSNINNNNFNTRVEFEPAAEDSKFLRYFSQHEISQMSNDDIFFFNHDHAFFKSDFSGDADLLSEYKIIASTTAKYLPKDKQIVAIIEHKKYPFYGVQFHPEKNKYESKINAARSRPAIEIMSKLGQFFCEQAGANTDQRNFGEIEKKLEEYKLYVGSNVGVFDEIYIFQRK